jgi:flagellar protein FlaG
MNIAPVEMGSGLQVVSVAAAAPKRNSFVGTGTGDGAAVSAEQIKRMVEEIDTQLQRMNVSLEFSRYGTHGEKIAVIVADKTTGEVIREIPSRELQDLYSRINDLAGIIFNSQA